MIYNKVVDGRVVQRRSLPRRGKAFEGTCAFSELSDQERIEKYSWYPEHGYHHNPLTELRGSYEVLPDRVQWTHIPREAESILIDVKLSAINTVIRATESAVSSNYSIRTQINLLMKNFKLLRKETKKATTQADLDQLASFDSLISFIEAQETEQDNRITSIQACTTREEVEKLLALWYPQMDTI